MSGIRNINGTLFKAAIKPMSKKFQIHRILRIPFKMEAIITFGKDLLNRFQTSGLIYKLMNSYKRH